MLEKIDWKQMDRTSLANSMTNTLSELDAVDAILYSHNVMPVNAQNTEKTDQNQLINIMDDLLAGGDVREIIKNIEIDARNYVVHGIKFTAGSILGLIYTNATPYRTIRKQSGYFLEYLNQLSQSDRTTSELITLERRESNPGNKIALAKHPEEVISSRNIGECDDSQTATPITGAERTLPATVQSTNNRDKYYLAGWN